MKRTEIIKNLDWLKDCAVHFANNPEDPDFGFWAHCSFPDMISQIEEELQPWWKKVWWRLQSIWRTRFMKFEDQIPF